MTTRSIALVPFTACVCAVGLRLSSVAIAQGPESTGSIQDTTDVPPVPRAPPPGGPAPEPSPLLPPYDAGTGAASAPQPRATSYVTPRDEDELRPKVPSEQAGIFGGYEIATPTGDLHDYIEESSFQGFEIGGLFPAYRGLHLGVYFNYHLFYEDRGVTTTQLQNGAVTAHVYRYTKFWSAGMAARYYLLAPDSRVRPYLGLRLGVAFLTAAAHVSDLSFYETPIGFAIAPEVGFAVRLAPMLALSLSVRYDYSTASSGPIDSASYVAYHMGVIFSTWE